MDGSTTLVDQLRSWRNRDGGWGYAPDRVSRLEPTSLALLALDQVDGSGPPQTLDVLARWPREGALLRESIDTPPNLGFNGLALLTLVTFLAPDRIRSDAARDAGQLADTLFSALTAHSALTGPDSPASRQNNSLRGWPWVESTFSWVEPTGWCLLALKKMPSRAHDVAARVREAERLLGDRACAGGGWNCGNANVFGTDLHPYVPTTAIALLSLQDRRTLPSVTAGLAFLREHATSESSVLALSLALLCAQVFGEPIEALRSALLRTLVAPSSATTVAAVALAACALSGRGHRAFEI